MKVIVVNQDPITVDNIQAQKLMQSVASGAEVVIVNGEMIKTSAIMGIRNEDTKENLPKPLWGALPAGAMKNFYADQREEHGEGFEKFQEVKRRLINRM